MLGRLILTTVGTSALDQAKLGRIRLWNVYQDIRWDLRGLSTNQLSNWVNSNRIPPKVEQFITAYVDEMLQYDIADEVQKPSRWKGINIFSAELSSLHLMYKDAELNLIPEQDSIVFVLSESAEGVLAGIINQRLISHPEGGYLKGQSINPQLTIVKGLQVDNFQQFFSEGLPAFVRCIRDSARGCPTKEPILNITGGFKALVAYSAYFGLAFQILMVFVFEESTGVVKIKPTLVQFTAEQRGQLLGEFRKMVAASLDMMPDAFDWFT